MTEPLFATRGFNDMSHHPCVATPPCTPPTSHTHPLRSASSSPRSLPVWPGWQWQSGGFQGPSVCSVTTVIVKQQVQAGPLLRYSQKAVGEESALL